MSSQSRDGERWDTILSTVCPVSGAEINNNGDCHFYLPANVRDWIDEEHPPYQQRARSDSGIELKKESPSPTIVGKTPARILFPILDTVCDANVGDAKIAYLLSIGRDRSLVHPLFHIDQKWIEVDPFSDCDVRIGPALVLASRIATSNRAGHFFNTLRFGIRSPGGPGIPGRLWRPCTSMDPHAELTSHATKAVQEALDAVVQETDIVFDQMTPSRNGSCGARFGSAYDCVTQQSFSGRSSRVTIRINHDFIAPHSVLMAKDLAKVAPTTLMRCWLQLAIALLEQVAHAFGFVCLNTDVELCLASSNIADYGKAFTRWLFGMDHPDECLDDRGIQNVYQGYLG